MDNNKINIKYMVKAGIIAAIYFVVTVIIGPFGYGVVQFRLSEALTILPMFESAAIPGLAIGCFFANIAGSPYGLADIVFGSLTTLLAAYITSKIKNKYIAVLPPILLNALIVPIYISAIDKVPYLMNVGTIGFGEFLSAGILGVIFATAYEKFAK